MRALLEAKGLTIKVGSHILCKELDLKISPHEVWGILGQNGSGKTTLMHTLSGLTPPHAGHIFLKNQPIQTFSRKTIAQQLGILFQNTSIGFDQTVYEYCAMARFPHLNDAMDAKHNMIIQQAIAAMELTSLSTQKISTLSGGERKRLYLAALLTQSPQLFLLDEPINHLDISYQIKVLKYFKQLSLDNSISILMSLHDINLAEMFCDKLLLLLKEGRWLTGDTKTLLTADNLQLVYEHTIKKNQVAWLPYCQE